MRFLFSFLVLFLIGCTSVQNGNILQYSIVDENFTSRGAGGIKHNLILDYQGITYGTYVAAEYDLVEPYEPEHKIEGSMSYVKNPSQKLEFNIQPLRNDVFNITHEGLNLTVWSVTGSYEKIKEICSVNNDFEPVGRWQVYWRNCVLRSLDCSVDSIGVVDCFFTKIKCGKLGDCYREWDSMVPQSVVDASEKESCKRNPDCETSKLILEATYKVDFQFCETLLNETLRQRCVSNVELYNRTYHYPLVEVFQGR